MAIGVTNKGVNILSVGEHRINSASCGNTIVYDKINGGGADEDALAQFKENTAIFTFNITEDLVGKEFCLYKTITNPYSTIECTVDYGDGVSEQVKETDTPNERPSHTYNKSGIYYIQVSGEMQYELCAYSTPAESLIASALTEIRIKGKSPLVPIQNSMPPMLDSLKLKHIDLDNLFNNVEEIILRKNWVGIFSLEYTFMWLQAEEKVSNKFFKNLYLQGGTIHPLSYCKAFCGSKISAIDSDIGNYIPNTEDINMEKMFQNCTGITGKLPELWLTHGNTIHEGCFNGCVNASNYSEVPSDWK